ncbi:MAG: aminotransferase class V-fold PLP-dependent enzyme [Epibacterium sp.]|nr:aminotransferase class V-fold PLP-dependent enzyme [Epibacterium sp.]NQX72749.1 aminotransferase class V-fold PLP-dependent enzyme [Epibacterium sp.]
MQTHLSDPTQFDRFAQSLRRPDLISWLQSGLIGDDALVPGPNGVNPLIYADYVASGRALRQVEDFVTEAILPYYANSHTEASYCGQMMTRLRRQARQIILESCKADHRYDLVFTGSGATAGLNRLVSLFAARPQDGTEPPLVILGPYEHHSNILPWRESGAEVIEIPEAPTAGPDLTTLEEVLRANTHRHIIGSFSAMSNVTGIVTDVPAVTRLLKRYGALSIWDYAGGAPYLDINLGGGTAVEIDAVVLSPHKFIGGPGASGVLILRREAVQRAIPTLPGGGTVSFVAPWAHEYSQDLVAREEAGTPNVVGDLRAALCFMVKDAIGQPFMQSRLADLRSRAEAAWANQPGLRFLGKQNAPRMPIYSFVVTNHQGKPIHQQLVTRLLSDLYGVQARGGCACAGPYGHRLLGIDKDRSDALRQAILGGRELEKPGWTRLGFSALMSDGKADKIIAAVEKIALTPPEVLASYLVDESTARFAPNAA